MLGILNSIQIEEVLNAELIGRIGCHATGTTYIVPISYAYDGTSIYARSAIGKKIDVMRSNPQVCFEVESYHDMANWRTVILWGEFEEIPGEDERKHALKMLLGRRLPVVASKMTQLSPTWPFHPADVNSIEGIVYKINVTKKTGRFENCEGRDEVSKAFL